MRGGQKMNEYNQVTKSGGGDTYINRQENYGGAKDRGNIAQS